MTSTFPRFDDNLTTASPTNWTGLIDADDDVWLRSVLYNIRMCFVPIIVGGTITNVLNLVVLTKREMRYLSTSVYLLSLAVADFGVMYFELFRVWFEWMDFVRPAVYFTDIYCKFANYLNGVTRDFSNWLVACLTLERVIMVANPYGARRLCTVARARTITFTLFLCICVPHCHQFFFSVAQKHTWWVCWEDPSSRVAPIIAAIVELSVGYVVVVVVFVLNISLVLLIYAKNIPRLGVGAQGGGVRQRRLTRTLLIIAVVFIVCETPRIILSFLCKFVHRTVVIRIVLNASYVISGVNHASNFIVYIVCSPRFRSILLDTLRRRRRERRGRTNSGWQVRVAATGRRKLCDCAC
ncbi:hypothetical protein NP493_567g02005 [Ridgeia piscesae]|uniref:G-protein coupled receptors family 1 profile domain-containing protein n=1 Tax=Ridgeia piscesae TaxID=27915 RepID=A0AAD9KUW6_RIDPI|nr:hypothetical protein NP493_567g02005 [Ridgeia piscesae]